MTWDPQWWLVIGCVATIAGMVLLTRTSVLRLVMVIVLGVIALQPQLGQDASESPPTGSDVVLMIDRTTSMSAQDHAGGQPRMDGVAADVEAIIEAMPQARYSVVAFDNEAHIAAPWTSDTTAILTLARTIGWREETYGTGSDVSVAVDVTSELLSRAAAARPGAQRYVIYFGDGEQTASSEPGSFQELGELVDGALVLGYGTTEGGVMTGRVGTDDHITRGGRVQLSHLDEARLRQISDELGGNYQHRGGAGSPEVWSEEIGVAAPHGSPGIPLTWLMVPLLALLGIADVARTTRAARLSHEEVAR